MNVKHDAEATLSRIAAAIGERARARILYFLMDGNARTSTELAIVADVGPSTASAHLNRLKEERLVKVAVRGKHRLYSLEGPNVARALESLSVLAGASRSKLVARSSSRLLAARTCYDHIAGLLGVSLHDRFKVLGWLSAGSSGADDAYELTPDGATGCEALGIDLEAARAMRRRFAYGCLDWSERRPHLGGALGAELLRIALKRKWVVRDLDSRRSHEPRATRIASQIRASICELKKRTASNAGTCVPGYHLARIVKAGARWMTRLSPLMPATHPTRRTESVEASLSARSISEL